jgi:lipoate-protein ligase B
MMIMNLEKIKTVMPKILHSRSIKVINHDGLVPYELGLQRQMKCVDGLLSQCDQDYSIHFLEHEHVLTIGKAVEASHMLHSVDALERQGFAVVDVSRGGSVTYHGPGQMISYVHIHLKECGLSLTGYLRELEQWVIDALAIFGVDSGRVDGKTGVWVSSGKICAMGISAKKFVTYHGIGLNYDVDLDRFQWFVPCGLSEPVANLSTVLGRRVSREEVTDALISSRRPWMR